MTEFPEAELRALGIDGLALGDAEALHVRTDRSGHGLRRGDAPRPTLEGLDAGGEFDFDPTSLVGPQRAHVRLKTCRTNPWLLQVSGLLGQPLSAVSVADGVGERDWLRFDADDPATIYLQLRAQQCVRVQHADGSGIAIRRSGDGFVILDFQRSSPCVVELAAVRAPLSAWATRTSDAWLAAELQQRAATDDSWSHAVGAGMHARFDRATGATAAERVARLLDGEIAENLLLSRRWARALGAAELRTIEDLGLAVAERVGRRLDGLSADLAPREAWWRDELLAACRERDDVEGVRVLLAEAGGAGRIAAALSDLDEQGGRLIAELPVAVTLIDERLARARLLPGAWWAALAAG